jgi:spore coat protein CotF
MLQDKTMVNDVLSTYKSGLTAYASAITECANPTLRAALQQIRNCDEASQYELYKMASTKGWYKPAAQASDAEVQQVKSQVQG